MVFNVPDSEERTTVVSDDLPYSVIELSNVQIPLKDGKSLYAHIWIPKESLEGNIRVGTLVEYLPYRKNDFTAIRDSIRHPYYAGFGFASIRVDMRGCGDSDDELHGEYLLQEQEDNLEVFDWIISQPWSNERIGQFGKSWGGFNGLQIAARQHPALKTIITLCSTDDRYADDVHYRGGCLLASDMLWWASTMLAYNARPQDPQVRSDWKENWLKRLDLEPNVIEWVKHQTRDEFWKHGSICENYNSVDIPVLAVGGWRDGYTNAIFRLMENLPNKESKGVIGPWVHEYPEVATPYPGLGYNQIAVKWFSKYLTTEESIVESIKTNLSVSETFQIESLSKLNAYIQEPCLLEAAYASRDGSWVGRNMVNPDNYVSFWFDSQSKSLVLKQPQEEASVSFTGTQEHGLFRGSWCPFGQDGDFPSDQKIEDSKCITFDIPIENDYSLLGFPVADLFLSSDCDLANISVRLVDIDPEINENYLVSWGVGNLSHYVGSDEYPEKLEPGKMYRIPLKLDSVGYNLKKGHILRVALSPCDWPSAWPLAKTPTLTLYDRSSIKLPLITVKETIEPEFWPKPESLGPCERKILREDSRTRKVVYDVVNNNWTIDDFSDEGKRLIVKNGVEMGSWNKNIWSIDPNDPLSAYNQCDWELTLGRGEDWQIKLVTTSSMKADNTNFLLNNKVLAYHNDELVFEKSWENAIPRNFT